MSVLVPRLAGPPRRRVLLLGAAGRDFHCFNTVYRDDPRCEVVAFTAAQIPGIDDLGSLMDVCARCVDQPCLSACPVSAFDDENYDVEACYGYLAQNPDSLCMTQTCEARFACPEGRSFNYNQAHARFHMAAFYRSIHARFSGDLD